MVTTVERRALLKTITAFRGVRERRRRDYPH
jgi:hypothetical protein